MSEVHAIPSFMIIWVVGSTSWSHGEIGSQATLQDHILINDLMEVRVLGGICYLYCQQVFFRCSGSGQSLGAMLKLRAMLLHGECGGDTV